MSKPLNTFASILGLTAGAAGALYYALFRRPLAQTSGAIRLPGLHHHAEVIRDRWGVPHIYADDPHDLFFAQGFVHAQDRLFQMEFGRRLGAGRLAEVVGPRAVEVDRWLRILGLRRVTEKEVPLLEDETRALLFAYASGVNAFIDRGKLPVEFSLLRYRPERWQIVDSLTWIKFMDWSLSVNWEAELLRARLIAHLGPELANQLDAPYPRGNPSVLASGIDWSRVGAGALSRSEAARPYTGPSAAHGLGSNNWVVDGSRSASGAPLLASDMHLNLTLPSIWYENHLCGAGYDVVGLSFVGLPGVIAGHNGRVAWSFTAGLIDTQDLYLERFNPEDPRQYEFKGAWHEAEVLREEIVVKGGAPVVQDVVITRHGPLIDGLVPDETNQPIALRWTALEPSAMPNLIFDIGRARDCAGFHKLLRRWTGPVQNIVYADVDGNIGYTLAGHMPLRVEGHDGRVPVPGWTGEYEWRGYVPFERLPHAINPPAGMFVTANAKPVNDDYPYQLGHAGAPGFRAARITELLEQTHRSSVADFCHMQFDQQSVLARRVGPHLARLESHLPYPISNTQSPVPNTQSPIPNTHSPPPAAFQDWDGDLSARSPLAAIYQVFIRRFLYNLFDTVSDEAPARAGLADRFIGQGLHPLLSATNFAYGANGRALLAHLLDAPDSPLFQKRSRDDLLLQSLREALDYLRSRLGPRVDDWRWGDLHQLTYVHPLGQVKPLDRLLNRGPFAIGGDGTTIWASSSFYHSLDDSRVVGPVCRFVVDLGDLSQSRSLNAPGQSGQPGSRHYADRIQAWFQGDYHPMLYYRQDVAAHTAATLHIKPAREGDNG